MRYNTIAKTVPLALPAELQALIDFFWRHRCKPSAGRLRYIPKFGGIELNRSLSQLSYRPIFMNFLRVNRVAPA